MTRGNGRTLRLDLLADPDELHDLAAEPQHAELLTRLQERLRQEQQRVSDDLPWTAAQVRPAQIDLTGRRWPPDRWQPQWIRDAYFPQDGAKRDDR